MALCGQAHASTHKTPSRKPRRTREMVRGVMSSGRSVVAAVEIGVRAVIAAVEAGGRLPGGGGRREVREVVERARERRRRRRSEKPKLSGQSAEGRGVCRGSSS